VLAERGKLTGVEGLNLGKTARLGVFRLQFLKAPHKHARVLTEMANPADFDLVQSCLEGDETAIERFQTRCGEPAVAFLVRAGATTEEAREIVQTVLTDCVMTHGTRRPRLATYSGRCALSSWLNTVALNQLLFDRRTKERQSGRDRRYLESDPSVSAYTESSGETVLAIREQATEAPLLELMRSALEAAFARLPAEQFVMLQLSQADGLRQHEIAAMFGCAASNVSRTVDRAMRQIQADTITQLRANDPWLELQWDDFLALCRSATPGCLGAD
jgi:RNA polymerase sigma factor (sigma-70 family)